MSFRARAFSPLVVLATVLAAMSSACSLADPSSLDASSVGESRGSGPGDAASRVTGRRERLLSDGERACDVGFVYAGGERERVFWREPCSRVVARMVDAAELRASGRWGRLDAFQRDFVSAMPGGLVMLIEGSSSASVYPIDETGASIEVSVAD